MIGQDLVILGFQVMASVEGSTKPQPISQRFTSQSAAETFRELARKQGFADAYVESVDGYEKSERVRREKKKVVPKVL
jgi:hypothetical protein